MSFSVLVLFCALFAAAQAPSMGDAQTTPPAASIRGRVTDAATGSPLARLPVRASATLTTSTDSQGHYALQDVPPGRHAVIAGSPASGASLVRVVTVAPGQQFHSFDFELQPDGTISGIVRDEDSQPLPGLDVVLIGREYFAGALRYYRRRATVTDDRGRYRLSGVPAGRGFLLLATQRNTNIDPVSDVPADPKSRRPSLIPSYYPNSPQPESAEHLVLRPGENRDNVDIQMQRSRSYCIEGVLAAMGLAEGMGFWIHPGEMSFGLGPSGGVSGIPPGGKSRSDGKFRICGLYPSDYRLTAYSGDLNSPDFFGTTVVNVADDDVRGVQVPALARLPLSGQVVWASLPPSKPVDSRVSVRLSPLHRTAGGLGEFGGSAIPGEFSVKTARGQDLLMDDYSVTVVGLPAGLYVKDVTYGNTTVLAHPLQLGSAPRGAELRVIVAHDGATLNAKVADKDGKPIPDAIVVLIPKHVGTETDLAALRTVGQCDQYGNYSSPAFAPGPYYVLATPSPVTDWSPESIGALWRARLKAREIDLGPNSAVQVTLEPMALH